MGNANNKSEKMRFIDIMRTVRTRQGSRVQDDNRDAPQVGASDSLESEISMRKEKDIDWLAKDEVILLWDWRRIRGD